MNGKQLKIRIEQYLEANGKGYTMTWLSKELGYEKLQFFTNIFKTDDVRVSVVQRICDVLQVPINEFLDIEKPSVVYNENDITKKHVNEAGSEYREKNPTVGAKNNVGLVPAKFYENEIYKPLIEALPTPANSNGWVVVRMDDEDLGMKPLSLSSIISQNNLTLMQKIPQDTIFRIPGTHADRIILVTAKNTQYAPGSEISICWRNKEDITFGYDYYLVLDNGEECIHIINRGKDDDHWELTSYHAEFYRGQIAVSRIKAIYDITVSLTFTRQKQQLKTH